MPPFQAGSPIPVGFITDLLRTGGAETQLVELVNALDPSRVTASVAVLRREAELLPRLRVPATVFGMGHPVDLRIVFRLRAWLTAIGARAVYTTHARSAVLAASLRSFLPVAPPQRHLVVISTEHSYRSAPASAALEPLRRRAVSGADRLIAVSRAQSEWLQAYLAIDPARIEVIPNGIDLKAYQGIPGGEAAREELGIPALDPVIVSVARLSPEKGQRVLLSAMETVPGHLVLVGDGPERALLEEVAAAPGLAGRVHFTGTRLDPRPYLAAATIFCLASREEALPVALIEAAASGLPAVATRVGGIPEVVEDGRSGLLVEPGNPVALAEALRKALGDAEWRRRAGEAARARAQREFGIDRRARKIEDLLLRLVEEAAR